MVPNYNIPKALLSSSIRKNYRNLLKINKELSYLAHSRANRVKSAALGLLSQSGKEAILAF